MASRIPRTLAIFSMFHLRRVLMKVAFRTSAAEFVKSAHGRDLYGSQYSTGTAVLTEEKLDWLRNGVVYPCARLPLKGRPPCLQALGEASGRSGRSTVPHPSFSTTHHARQY